MAGCSRSPFLFPELLFDPTALNGAMMEMPDGEKITHERLDLSSACDGRCSMSDKLIHSTFPAGMIRHGSIEDVDFHH